MKDCYDRYEHHFHPLDFVKEMFTCIILLLQHATTTDVGVRYRILAFADMAMTLTDIKECVGRTRDTDQSL